MFTDPHVQGYWRETYRPSWTDSQGRPHCGSHSDALNESHGDRRVQTRFAWAARPDTFGRSNGLGHICDIAIDYERTYRGPTRA
jgi:hypothetical protein